MKVLTFAKDKELDFIKTNANLMVKNVDTSVTTQTSSRLAALELCIKAKVCILLTS